MRRRESTEYGLLAARENGGQVAGFGGGQFHDRANHRH